MKLKYLVLLSLAPFTNLALADVAEPCGPPGEYVSVGESQQDVIANCGQPTTSNISQVPVTTGQTVRWYYTLNSLRGTDQPAIVAASEGARYIVEFVDGKVNLIYSAELTYEEYDFCGTVPQARGEIDRGDSMEKVRGNCGDPTFTNVMSQGTTQNIETTQYIYQFDPTSPETVVTIQNGIVTDIQ